MDNYPPGFNPKELDNLYDSVELPEEMQTVACTLTIKCGEDEEIVYSATFASLDDLEESGLRKAQRSIEDWQKEALDHYIDGLQDEKEDY